MPFNTDPSPHLRDYYQKTTDWATSLRAQYDEDEQKEAHWISQKVAVSNQKEKADPGVAALAMVNKVLDTTPAFIQWRDQVKKKSEEKVHLKLSSFKMSKEDREAFNKQWEKSQEEDIRFNKVASTIKDPALKEYIQSLNPGKIKHAKSYFSKIKAQNLGKIFIDAQEANAKDSSGIPFLDKLRAVEKEGAVAYSDFITNWAGEQLVEGSLSNGLIAKNVMPSIDSFVKTENSRFAKDYKDKATTDNDTEIEQTLEMDLNYQSILSDGQGGLSVDPHTPLKTISFATRNLAAKLVPEDIPAGMTADQYAGKIVWGKVFSRAEKGLITEAQKTQILSGLVPHGAGKELLDGEKATGPALLLKNAGYSVSDFSEAVERGQRASLELQVTEIHSQGEKQANAQMLKCSKEGCSAEEVASTIETLKRDFAGYNNDDLNRMKGGGNNDPDLFKSLSLRHENDIKTGSIEKWDEKTIEANSKGNIEFKNFITKRIALIKTSKLSLNYSDKPIETAVNEGGKFQDGQAILTANGLLVSNDVKKVLNENFIANIVANPADPDAYSKALITAQQYFINNGGGKGNEIQGKFSSGDKNDYEIYKAMFNAKIGYIEEAKNPSDEKTWKTSLYLNGKRQPPTTYGQLEIGDFIGMKGTGGYTQEVLAKAREHGLRPGDYVKKQWDALLAYSKGDSKGAIELQKELANFNQGEPDLAQNIPGLDDADELRAWTAAEGDPNLLYALKFTDPKDFSPVLQQRLQLLVAGYDAQIMADKAEAVTEQNKAAAAATKEKDRQKALDDARKLEADTIKKIQDANDKAKGRSLAGDLVNGTQAAVANPAQYFGTNQFSDQTPDLDEKGEPLPPLEYKGF